MRNIQVGAQLFSCRSVMQDRRGIEEGLGRLARIGYDCVQLSGIPVGNDDMQWFRQCCDQNGLRIVSMHNSIDWMLKDSEQIIKNMRILGCDELGIGAMPEQYWTDTENLPAFADMCRQMIGRLQPHGIRLFHHNHLFELKPYGGQTILEFLRDAVPQLKFMLDTYWLAAGGFEPSRFISRFRDRITQIHLKDLATDGKQTYFTEIGNGNIDFVPIITAALDAGVDTFLVEQDTCPGDPIDSLAQSYAYIRKTLLPK